MFFLTFSLSFLTYFYFFFISRTMDRGTKSWTSGSLKILLYLKGEGVRIVPCLLQQGLVHGAQLGLVALRVDLYLLEPDVLPEAQAHHIQVLTAITEGTGQLYESCNMPTFAHLSPGLYPVQADQKEVFFITFSVTKICCVHLDDTI